MNSNNSHNAPYIEAISKSSLSIYNDSKVGDPNLWIPTKQLEEILNVGLCGISIAGLPIRTRSKMVKELICKVLGYPVPNGFKKTQPRFPGQNFDTYIQKSDNLQVWNEEIDPGRRYVIIKVSDDDIITRVKVVLGTTLAQLDTTGTLTQKYQARCILNGNENELISSVDTENIKPFVSPSVKLDKIASPTNNPCDGQILPIDILFQRLTKLVGLSFIDAGSDQERNRGAMLHKLVCEALGYTSYLDDGQFPDITHQITEIKLQTSPTIDLGLVSPNSTDPINLPPIVRGHIIRHCDVRYAIFCGDITDGQVRLLKVILTTGEDFFRRFPQFQGRVLNKKLQIPLPANFFDR